MEEHISGQGYLQKKRGSGLWEPGHKMLPWLNALHFIIKCCLITCSYCIRGSASAFHIYSSVAAISPFSLRSVVKCSCTPLLSTAGISFHVQQKKNILGFSTGFKGYWTWTPEGRLSLNLSFAHASQESDKIPLHRIYLPEFGYLVWSHHGNNVISTEKQAWLVSGCSTLCFSTYCFSITSGTLIEAAISDFYR